MEAYPGDPYAYMPTGGGRRKFRNIEGVLPLVLLIVIAFFVLQFLRVIPCVIPIGCGGEANVLVVGVPSQDVMQVLSSKETLYKGIHYGGNFNCDIITADTLRSYNVVILQGDPFCDMNGREAINQYVQGGGKLIVVGDAGSKHPLYPNVAGWSWPSGQGIPVPAKLMGEWGGWSDVAVGSVMRMVDVNHAIVKGLKIVGSTFERPAQVFKVTPEGGRMIMAVDTTEGTMPAIIEGAGGFGSVLYFSYDPGVTKEVLLVAIKYMAGI